MWLSVSSNFLDNKRLYSDFITNQLKNPRISGNSSCLTFMSRPTDGNGVKKEQEILLFLSLFFSIPKRVF